MGSSPAPTRVGDPLGVGGERLHEWVVALGVWREAHGKGGGEVNASTQVMEEELLNIGATIMGRNMFGGHPGPWDAKKPWIGWWGTNPPFHHPVFVLTHHARDPLRLDGGTTFTFVTDGIESAREQAKTAANGKDVALAGGERLLDGIGDNLRGLELVRTVAVPNVTHGVRCRKSTNGPSSTKRLSIFDT